MRLLNAALVATSLACPLHVRRILRVLSQLRKRERGKSLETQTVEIVVDEGSSWLVLFRLSTFALHPYQANNRPVSCLLRYY
jgi:hypothetical protein